ncbi:Cub1 protein [Saccharomycopsis crataegensis]|uniref:Cub1 protein n=1 Tax=Saccharomycopsis crataegensis TaxID=43959 RepID=A0AAV5QSK2_9ASCO|nr:Cub1 protein [Saccharomycopsis crataegensis]
MHTNEVPESEREVYNALIKIRARLSVLKNNRKEFMKSQDVKKAYDEVLSEYNKLKEIRSHYPTNSSKSRDKSRRRSSISALVANGGPVHNKVDSIVDENFQLLSLSFMTVGLTKTAPATYASLSTVQRLLEHLVESKVYTKHDLKPIKDRLDEISVIIKEDDFHKFGPEGSNSNQSFNAEQDLLAQKLKHCVAEYNVVEKNIDEISPELTPYLDELIGLRRLLMALVTRRDDDAFDDNDFDDLLKKYEVNLKDLEKHRDENGAFLTKDDKEIQDQKGQVVLNGLLDECHNIINDLTIAKTDSTAQVSLIDKELLPLFQKLVKIKVSLENLLVTRRWTLRETDLFNFQRELQKIDDLRVDGKFRNPSTHEPYAKGQTMLLYLLRRCYAIIYKLLESSEPVSEALQPVHNQLSTVRRCLLDVKRMGGINSTRELYPYQMKLASIDDVRVDGKFIVDGQIPEGQGTLNALLAECYDICYELRVELDENNENGEDDEDYEDEDENREERQYDELEEEDYDDDTHKNLMAASDYEYDSYLPSENVTDNEMTGSLK